MPKRVAVVSWFSVDPAHLDAAVEQTEAALKGIADEFGGKLFIRTPDQPQPTPAEDADRFQVAANSDVATTARPPDFV